MGTICDLPVNINKCTITADQIDFNLFFPVDVNEHINKKRNQGEVIKGH